MNYSTDQGKHRVIVLNEADYTTLYDGLKKTRNTDLRGLLAKVEPADTQQRKVSCPADAASVVMPMIGESEQENFVVVALDTRGKVIEKKLLYVGSVNTMTVRIGEIMRMPVVRQAAAFVVAHNHPSGNPDPSPEDVAVTRQIINAGKLLDIPLMDHVIVASGRYVSLKERGLAFTD